jgi:hypothetical protein
VATLPASKRSDAAEEWVRSAIQSDLKRARAVAVSDPSKVEFYSPPAVLTRAEDGMVDKSPFVSIRTVATAVDASEVQ